MSPRRSAPSRRTAVEELRAGEARLFRQRNALIELATGGRSDGGDTLASLRRITEIAARTLDVARVSIWRFDTGHASIRCVDLYELAADRHSSGTELAAADYPSYFRALQELDVIAADDAHGDSRTSEFSKGYLRPLGIASMMDALVRLRGAADGVLCHEHVGAPRRWTADERTFAAAAANLVSLALEELERRGAEDALRASEAKYRRLLESNIVGVIYWSLDGSIVDANDLFLSMVGYTRDDLSRGTLRWTELTPPEHAAADAKAVAELSATGACRPFEKEYIRKDGSRVAVLIGSALLEGHDDRGSSFVMDVTERRKAEETLRLQSAALNAAASAIVITDREGAIVWLNPAFTVLTGYAAEESLGRNPRELLKSGVHDPAFYAHLWDTLLAGEVWRGEMTNRRKNGSLYPEEMTVTPVKDARGEITHFIAIKRDLSEEKHLQAQFLQAQRMESVGRLAGGIAHDFNNLLTVITGSADLATMSLGEDAPPREHLVRIREAGERAASLTRQLLAFSRKQIMTTQVLSLSRLVTNLQGMVRRLIGEDIDLVVLPADDLGQVRADPGQVEQVILNLVVNARDAMPDGGTLTIETRDVELDESYAASHPTACPGPHVLLTIADTGIGMDEATRGRIFEPFFTTKELGKGTGLGLATVYGIVKQSQGTIWVYSEPGRGTTFKIYFPRVEAAAPEDRPARPLTSVPGTETILLVEDEEALRELAKSILQSAGYTVLTAPNGAEAVAVLERHEGPVHLLLTDVVLPGINGRELAARVAENRPKVKVLFTSGYTDDAILRHGVLDNVAHFIGKPYTIAQLTRKVREILDEPQDVPA